jgi:hypothetical protein
LTEAHAGGPTGEFHVVRPVARTGRVGYSPVSTHASVPADS